MNNDRRSLSLSLCGVLMLVSLPADAQFVSRTFPQGTRPPFPGANAYFDEIWINPTGESNCANAGATCFEPFSFALPAGYDDAVVFIADFMVRDEFLASAPIRRVAATISNVDYLSSSGNLSFDVTVTFDDGGGFRAVEWTMAVGVLLFGESVAVSAPFNLSCDTNSDATCTTSQDTFDSNVQPPGYQFQTYLPVGLSWQARGTETLLSDGMRFDISQSPTAPSPGTARLSTECGITGVSPTTGSTVPTRCGQVVRALASAWPLYTAPSPATDSGVGQVNAEQNDKEDGLWSALFTADPANSTGMIPVWVRGGLRFPNPQPFWEVGGGCSNPEVQFGFADTGLLEVEEFRSWFREPPNCDYPYPHPFYLLPPFCVYRQIEEDFDHSSNPSRPEFQGMGLDYRLFTARFIGYPGVPFTPWPAPGLPVPGVNTEGRATCRLLDVP